ncbi:hypothetical protein [Bradyrhizobium sp. CCGUVB14]|uniref:hypothetical protein n=1 Tax=Bradyrhizobium sp. CCGUVB14 TaxID=2949628 RepID=UPI0020B204C3|nr:hypothetical protein [Bradyrhizobium sp. CCGUVB14]MCP3442563.1 hypothetical protein [Bradyrhizobium sp. CCGUVB14]
MRFWTLPFDRHLTQWLQAVDPSRPSIMVAREFGGQKDQWQFDRAHLLAMSWLEDLDLAWQPDPLLNPQNPNANAGASTAGWNAAKDAAFNSILGEIEELQMLMQDDRDRYMAEIIEQADGSGGYITAFIDTNESRRPWTMELINCGYAIGNVAYFYYKQQFRRVRPSTLCPGLAPPFGPPAHPSFTSGHSFIGHFIALLLLEIPALRQRYGMFAAPYNQMPGKLGTAVDPNPAVTISFANTAVATLSALTAHGLSAGDPVRFQQVSPALRVTISQANPGVVTVSVLNAHGLSAGDRVQFQPIPGAPALPTHIGPPPDTYYVLPANLTANSFEVATTAGGNPIDTTPVGGGTPPPVPAVLLRNPPPAPIVVDTTYFVLAPGLTANSFGIGDAVGNPINTTPVGGGAPPAVPALLLANPLMGRGELTSPLLWLAGRIAKNRERLGVHYASDSTGSRHLAAGIWRALLHDSTPSRIYCPTLRSVLAHATAEWPTKWP